jgi:predicted nucleic acid-binding protein
MTGNDVIYLFTMSLTRSATIRARVIWARHAYTWWDCLLLASALELGCKFSIRRICRTGKLSKA